MKTHRKWFKILLNPLLRILGWSIVSHIDEDDKVIGYSIRRYPENCRKVSE